VIIRYSGGQKATGGTVTFSGAFTIHTFTSSGTFQIGTHIGDLSGNRNNGALVNGPTFTSGNLGGLVFDGANDRISTSSFTYTPRSISVWLYNNSIINANDGNIGGPSDYQTLFSFGGGTPGVNLGGWTGGATNEAIHIWSTSGGARLTYTNQAVPIGIHNFVFNWNGTHYDIWVDGAKQTVLAGGGGHASLITYTNVPIHLCSDTGTYEFWGTIYSFFMYDNALSDFQVLQNYNATKRRYGL
jgi:hypothetical protein